MPPSLSLALAVAAAYMCGSIPFGFLIAKHWHGVDLRKEGSGNIGATNVGRTLGKGWGSLCLLLDFAKGMLPTLLPLGMTLPVGWTGPAMVACGIAAIVGHVFPVWLGFRGGKGVATGAGVAAVLSWPAAIAAVATFAVLFGAKRIVSLASIFAAIVYAAATLLLLREPLARQNWPTALFAVAIPTLIIVRHRENIGRLWRGEEKPFSVGKSRETGATSEVEA